MNEEALALLDALLQGLTDFQRATVAVVDARFAESAGARLLVADEVGLGKTLVARGVIAELLKRRLKEGVEGPLRVVYVCSNQALAHENVQKLAVFDVEHTARWVSSPSFSRLAELGLDFEAMQPRHADTLLEICSLTPQTSLALSQGHGNAPERYIVWRALAEDRYIQNPRLLENFFSKDVQRWSNVRAQHDNTPLVRRSLETFHRSLTLRPELPPKLLQAARDASLTLRSWRTLLEEVADLHARRAGKQHAALVSFMRARTREIFVASCVQNLQAELFVLDEFQRFKELLDPKPDAEQGRDDYLIARQVLHRDEGHHTLLLSATPFKALTHLREEEVGSAHVEELKKLFGYLTRSNDDFFVRYEATREKLLAHLMELPEGPLAAGTLDDTAKRRQENLVSRYVARTEREQLLRGAPNALAETGSGKVFPVTREIREFSAIDRLGEKLKAASEQPTGIDMMQLFKNAPWCLSFSGSYKVRELLQLHRRDPGVAPALASAADAWIPAEAIDRYTLDLTANPPSARFAELLQAAMPPKAEQLLWVPPSVPYYLTEGPFAQAAGFSKTLLFSSLVIAPRALSSLVSYECERRLLPRGRIGRHRYEADRSTKKGPLSFESKSISPAFGLVYPCERLAGFREFRASETLEELRARLREQLRKDVRQLERRHGSQKEARGSRWYTLAPFLLDRLEESTRKASEKWFSEIAASKSVGEPRKKDARQVKDSLTDDLDLGKAPADLLDYLLDVAIGGPAVCLIRSLRAVNPQSDHGLGVHATNAALAFLGRMNQWESQRAIQAVSRRSRPWIELAQYCALGNLQATIDEYVHLLRDQHRSVAEVVEALQLALGIGASDVTAQKHLPHRTGDKRKFDFRFHCHYAVPLGNQNITDAKGVKRVVNVRAAFNSPFRPFLLNSTSIGQEGLDFHWYCRRVVHWSLPSNPIDIEQREGRVNRYKSLLVRQRLAAQLAEPSIVDGKCDFWEGLFVHARNRLGGRTDLEPYWFVNGTVPSLERLVPSVSFSAERTRLPELLRVLSLYRLCFGQPRQEELLESLLKHRYTDEDLREIRRALIVDLAPISVWGRGERPISLRELERPVREPVRQWLDERATLRPE